MSHNKLKTIPLEILNLKKLRKLELYHNSFEKIPKAIFELHELHKLYIDFNRIQELPPEIKRLTKLTKLEMSHNLLKKLPKEIGELIELETLDLGNNYLESIPKEIGNLTYLTTLLLNNNNLKSIPNEIGRATLIYDLILHSNQLKSIPLEIKKLKNLSCLQIDRNYLQIPPEIVEDYKNPKKIIDYFFSLEGKKQPLHEAKMLLVGQGSVGKTCLRERLIRNKYDPTRNKTDGIDIESWNIEVGNRDIQVNVWDFGGQEIMHSTHQFFLTLRSLYLLVIDTTQGEEENRLEHWLKIIQSFAKDSPVIIVGNKADQHPLDIDRRGLQQKYPQIKAFIEASCQDSIGIEELEIAVKHEIGKLKHVDDELPLPWFNIKTKLEELDKDYIPYGQYESLCEAEGITDEDKQSILIRLLHDLGIVLNFRDDPRLEDTHVLNPEWVTNGVYKILNNHQLIVDCKGILDRTMLPKILDRRRYPKNKYLFIIDMMRKFELCFDIEADKQFLIPDILPKEEPYTGEWDNNLAFEYHYPVLPNSVIARFIVRMNHCIYKNTCWRSGVVLNKEGNTALVKADREDKKIAIHIQGEENTRRNLLTAIRSQFDYIHKKNIPGIVPIEKVPLIEHPEIVLDYQELLGLEAMGETSVAIGKLKKRIPLKQLLDGIEAEDSRQAKVENNSDAALMMLLNFI